MTNYATANAVENTKIVDEMMPAEAALFYTHSFKIVVGFLTGHHSLHIKWILQPDKLNISPGTKLFSLYNCYA